MGRYVNGKWHEELPDLTGNGGNQSNSDPVGPAPSSGGGGSGGSSTPAPSTPSSSGGADTFSTKNGQQTVATMASQLVAAGWGGNVNDPAAVTAAYASTTGGSVTPMSSGGGSGGGSDGSSGGISGDAASQLAAIQQSILNSIGSGNKAAADEAAKEFAQTFGLDLNKFQESVREYNQNFTLAEAGITGMYNGQPTEAALNNANQTALGVLNLAAGLHSDPFRQLNVMYGANGVSGLKNAVNGLTGQFGLPGSFTAPAGANSANLGGLLNEFNSAGSGPSGTQLAASTGLNNTNQIIARNFNSAPQNVQDAATSALSMNTGQDQTSVNKAIQNNLPKFTSPAFGLADV